jgi:hypothetical protein
MSAIVRNTSKGFWDQYPIGTKLDWSFLSHQLNQNRIGIFNSFMLFMSLYFNLSRPWTVLIVPLLSTINRDAIQQHVPAGSRVSKYLYLTFTYLIGILLCVLALSIAVIISLLALVILPILAVVVLGVWALIVLFLFFLWLTLYRYPAFEVIYPRLRKRILVNNSRAYSQLSADSFSVRVVRLKAGNRDDKINCDLVAGPLSTMDFEALSYVWGLALLPHTIQVNGVPFYVTSNLYDALKELRHPKQERLLWIDAMCINQYDEAEKAVQVQRMRDIYAKASRTIVWLGQATKATLPTLDLVQQFGTAEADTMDTLWKDRTTLTHWSKTKREF